jgi:hypothetical protein
MSSDAKTRREPITAPQLDAALAKPGVRVSEKMRMALRAILVHGSTWRQAAHRWDVTESGIHRAMRRYGL